MGLFKDQHDKAVNNTTTTIITQHSKVTGDFLIKGNLHLDGIIDGNIKCDHTITIGKSGDMNGEVSSKSFCLSGKFEGTCHTKHMEILAGGVFKGSLYTVVLVILQGGHFLGNSHGSNANEAINETTNENSAPLSSLELVTPKDSANRVETNK
jgi:cytoskeletal protein CcmA (bactofilin family)